MQVLLTDSRSGYSVKRPRTNAYISPPSTASSPYSSQHPRGPLGDIGDPTREEALQNMEQSYVAGHLGSNVPTTIMPTRQSGPRVGASQRDGTLLNTNAPARIPPSFLPRSDYTHHTFGDSPQHPRR
jgi:hypothetical protein